MTYLRDVGSTTKTSPSCANGLPFPGAKKPGRGQKQPSRDAAKVARARRLSKTHQNIFRYVLHIVESWRKIMRIELILIVILMLIPLEMAVSLNCCNFVEPCISV